MEFINEKFEKFKRSIKNKKVAIIGLGVSNIPLIEYLHSLEANITLFHNKDIENIDKEILEKMNAYNITIYAGENYLSNLTGFNMIFRTPSCRPDLPEIIKAVNEGAILTSEIELLLKLCPSKTIGITGSDGKTTTTSLIYEILKKQGFNCFLGGNIGTPLFTKIEEMEPEDIVILELSSFQLMNIAISPNIAIITNITPNHLDIHKSYEEYINAKTNIFKHQTENDMLILNYDNDITREFKNKANRKSNVF